MKYRFRSIGTRMEQEKLAHLMADVTPLDIFTVDGLIYFNLCALTNFHSYAH